MNTFTFSGKIDTEILIRKHPVTKGDYAKFYIEVDDCCRLEVHAFGDPGYDIFKFGQTGDRIEGVAKLFCSKIGTHIQIVNFNFIDKDLNKLKQVNTSDVVLKALKERLRFDRIVNNLHCVFQRSLSESDVEELVNNVLICIVSSNDPKVQENAAVVNYDNITKWINYLVDGNQTEGYSIRHMYNLQKYVESCVKNETV